MRLSKKKISTRFVKSVIPRLTGSRTKDFREADVAMALKKSMEDTGIKFVLGSKMKSAKIKTAGVLLGLENDTLLESDVLFFAAGRTPNTDRIGLSRLGIKVNEKGEIQVNENYQTNLRCDTCHSLQTQGTNRNIISAAASGVTRLAAFSACSASARSWLRRRMANSSVNGVISLIARMTISAGLGRRVIVRSHESKALCIAHSGI